MLIEVQAWSMPEKTLRDALNEMCLCGHPGYRHRRLGLGKCIACEEDPRAHLGSWPGCQFFASEGLV